MSDIINSNIKCMKSNLPKSGNFYWHMKHVENDFFSFLYVVIGISFDTEEEHAEVIYAPLYESKYKLFNRDIVLFLGEKDGKPRFTKVSNETDIQKIYDSGRATKWTNIFNR